MRDSAYFKATIVYILYVLVCAGCDHSSPPTIAFIPQTTADDLWEPAHQGSLDATKATGYSIFWNGPTSDGDVQTQIDLLDEAVERHAVGIILAPVDSLALMTSMQEAASSNVPTVIIGSPLPSKASKNLFYVLNDEQEEGRIAARRIGEQLGDKGSVAILGLDPNDSGQFKRVRTFEATLLQQFPHITIHSRYLTSSSEAQAEQIAHSVVTGTQRPDAILALTRRSAMGAIRAMESRGKGTRIILVGCDQNYALLYDLSQGKLDSIIAQNTYEMGFRATQFILAARTGGHPTGTDYVKPILVTRENMSSPDLLNILTHDARVRH